MPANMGYDFSIRPSAAFSEPSYLGGVSLFLHFVCLHTLRGRARILASLLALLACAVAQTFYGMFANAIILFAFYHRYMTGRDAVRRDAGLAGRRVADIRGRTGTPRADPVRRRYLGRLADLSALVLLGYTLSNDPFGVPMTMTASYFQQTGLITASKTTRSTTEC